MSQSPRLSETKTPKGSSQSRQPISAPMLLFVTALDTTWRAFVPTLGGTFVGIGLDAWLHSAPIGVISCLILGTILSIVLIARQLINIRKPLR
jgi:F0F1-type ATP synthase assembly protein I